ncbi:vinorine synthase-like [Silene latifolia]|uniref:vinorine synthase-like n=1 Tax=Silene latifolia TaxID=37657 RepID=UPI003D782C68
MEVKEISRENIKPCTSTPTHLKQLKLSLFDQTTAPLPTPTLLFYPVPYKTTRQILDVTHLKTTLSRTLDSFYPLAGRYTTWDTIDCNDQGVPFIVTHVNCPLTSVLNFNGSTTTKLELLSKLYPPTEFAVIGSGIQVAIQINVFSCGGFVLGWYHSHKPLDGVSASTFLRHWAALSSNRNPQQLPDFVAGLTAFPQYPPEKDALIRPRMASFNQRTHATNESLLASSSSSSSSGVDIVVKSFVFKRTAVADLKARAASKDVMYPSRFLAVSGFIWKHLLQIQRRSALGVMVNVRPRANPPLANNSIGNLCEVVKVDLADHDSDEATELPELVTEIYSSISKIKI